MTRELEQERWEPETPVPTEQGTHKTCLYKKYLYKSGGGGVVLY